MGSGAGGDGPANGARTREGGRLMDILNALAANRDPVDVDIEDRVARGERPAPCRIQSWNHTMRPNERRHEPKGNRLPDSGGSTL